MRGFLREYWLWILAPMLIVAVVVGVVILATADEGSPAFIYPLF